MTTLTHQLADFVASAHRLNLDEAVRATVRMGFIDTVGVMLAGQDEPVTRIVRQFVAANRSPLAESSVLLGPARAAARDAALVNAAAGHALDYDDVGLMGHPSVVLVPALLAEAERLHARGSDVIAAYVAGYEVWAELILREQDRHHVKGWHPTAAFGVVAAASAVAALRRLDAPACRHALGIAASMAGGLIANFGSMTKPLHAGQAAAAGIDAVNLAQLGLTASPDAIEHHAGFLAALSPAGRVERGPAASGFGQDLRIASLGLTVKKYPMCFATHRVIDGVLDLARANAIAPGDVRRVRATVGATQASMLRNHAPANALEAKFSLEFAVAAALAAQRVTMQELSDAFVARPDVQGLFKRVEIRAVDTVCPDEPSLALSDRVVIETADGRLHDSGDIFETRGNPRLPLSLAELKIKFDDCARQAGHARADVLFERLSRLDTLDDVASLTAD